MISDWLAENEALSVTLTDAENEALFVEGVGETPLWKNVKVEALFPSFVSLEKIKQKLTRKFFIDHASYEESELAEDDWEKSFRQHFQPQCFSGRLSVYPTWYQEKMREPFIILEPGLAFGTGTHPTTKLCLNYLAQQDLTNQTVIDYGCGSGILAIAAAKLGAKIVYAVDHDPQALEATKNNATLNSIAGSLAIIQPEEMPNIQADLVIANIFSSVLIALREKLALYVKKGSLCILSGILLTQLDEVERAYWNDFKKISFRMEDEWVLIALKKVK